MLNIQLPTRQRSQKVDISLIEKIIPLTLEPSMWLLLDLKDNITRLQPRYLITFTTELNLMTTLNTTIDGHLQDLPLDNGLLATALLAPVAVLDHLTFAIAIIAHGLEALYHWSHLPHHHTCTRALARTARLDSTFLTTTSIAARTDDALLQSELRGLAAIDILQRNLMNVMDCPSLLRTGVAHAATEHTAE